MLEITIFSLLNGTVYGLLLFMLSSGLTLIFSMMGILNFAHASFYMLGAYFGYTISSHIGFWPGLIFAPLIVGVMGALLERYALRHVHKHGHVAELIFTFGLAFLLEELTQFFWGTDQQAYKGPSLLDFPLFTLFDANFPAYKAFMLLISIGIFLGLLLVLTRTRVGLIIQAAITHPNMVNMLGHNVPFVFMATFGVGTALAGLAGTIAGPVMGTYPGMAHDLGSIVFVVVVFGGLGSLAGALVASLMIGIIQTFAVGLNYSVSDFLVTIGVSFPADHFLHDIWTMTLPQVAPLIPYLMLILILIFRPMGLFGTRET
ncbi:MAG: branched-chain amino acid ABC transporter permease [Rhodospirillales bacterium]|nr:branched-chain amino acid ABC transporter permease [Rhodospirillales bacterium]MCW8860932.1 branched-chain amino acid ABC transporter permease [Rhodospirillales bacterium]MCW8952756.1 branched-chain amino acid ABC transporter permease [Rhodospirillales bacterium]MCW8970210.1 branched-chain amino acid ABC transporter permease [Rhodospirillales bacterium]MCW9003153.1 branched-chain amino acid ABC transporter permease [Rhodospirillales bacterium]